MFNPPHPGETLKEDVLPALGLKVTDAAAQLGVTRPALSRACRARAGRSGQAGQGACFGLAHGSLGVGGQQQALLLQTPGGGAHGGDVAVGGGVALFQ